MLKGICAPKRIEFRYNDRKRDVEIDRNADLPFYEAGDIVRRRGKYWKVVRVLILLAVSGPPTLLSFVVSLTDKF